jgi:hypothetical protein
VPQPVRRAGKLWPLVVAGVGLLLAALGIAGVAAVWLWRSDDVAPPGSASYDAARFDAVGFYSIARRHARQTYPGALLVTLTVQNVGADGRATLSDGKTAAYTFRSTRAAPKTRKAQDVLLDDCYVVVTVSTTAVLTSRAPGNCLAPTLKPPKCDMREVMSRAKLPPNGRALVQLTTMVGRQVWLVMPDSGSQQQIADDC